MLRGTHTGVDSTESTDWLTDCLSVEHECVHVYCTAAVLLSSPAAASCLCCLGSAAALVKTDKLLSLRARTKREKKRYFPKTLGRGASKNVGRAYGLFFVRTHARTDARTDGQKEVVFGVCLPQEKREEKVLKDLFEWGPTPVVETSSTVWE